jgi:Domain of unknown function (DUF4304)
MDSRLSEKLNTLLVDLGFKRRKNRWIKEKMISSVTSLVLCEIQKSQYSNTIYLNFGVYYIGLLNKSKPSFLPSYDCHFVGRYEQILFNKGSSGISCEILDSEFDQVLQNIRFKIVPFLEKLSDPQYMIEEFLPNYKLEYIWLQNIRQKELTNFLASKI